MKVRAQFANLTSSSRTAAALLVGAALVASLGGAALYKASEKTVLLSVDGRVRPVRSHSATVGDVLAAAGLRVREHDLLAPGADEKVADGGSVSLRRGRSLELTFPFAQLAYAHRGPVASQHLFEPVPVGGRHRGEV